MNSTKGPWEASVIEGDWHVVKPKESSLLICRLAENNPANARLIAAAPEMLSALEQACKKCDTCYLTTVGKCPTCCVRKALMSAKGTP